MRLRIVKTLDLYIIKKFLGTFFFSIAIIISIAIIFDFAEKLDDFVEKEAPISGIVFDYYLNFAPYFANLFSFLFTFIAVIFFTSKMAARTEIIAILSSGISFRRFLYPYFISATIIATLSFLLSSYIIPPANKERLEFAKKYIKNPYRNREKNIHKQISPGVYIYLQSFNNQTNTGYKFSVEEFENGHLKGKLFSDYVKWDSTEQKWTIYNYYIRHIDGMSEEIEQGKKKDTIINLHPEEFSSKWYLFETMTNPELDEYIRSEQMRGGQNLEPFILEKYKRYAFPFSSFILTLIGVSLASRKTRGGTGAHIGLGILISFSYILFMQVTSQFAISGSTSPIIAVWIPNVIFSIIALYLYSKAHK